MGWLLQPAAEAPTPSYQWVVACKARVCWQEQCCRCCCAIQRLGAAINEQLLHSMPFMTFMQALDLGAAGIMVPTINTVSDVEKAVSAMYCE